MKQIDFKIQRLHLEQFTVNVKDVLTLKAHIEKDIKLSLPFGIKSLLQQTLNAIEIYLKGIKVENINEDSEV